MVKDICVSLFPTTPTEKDLVTDCPCELVRMTLRQDLLKKPANGSTDIRYKMWMSDKCIDYLKIDRDTDYPYDCNLKIKDMTKFYQYIPIESGPISSSIMRTSRGKQFSEGLFHIWF